MTEYLRHLECAAVTSERRLFVGDSGHRHRALTDVPQTPDARRPTRYLGADMRRVFVRPISQPAGAPGYGYRRAAARFPSTSVVQSPSAASRSSCRYRRPPCRTPERVPAARWRGQPGQGRRVVPGAPADRLRGTSPPGVRQGGGVTVSPAGRLFVGVQEAAELLGLSDRTVHCLVAQGELPSLKVGRRRLLPLRRLEDWAEARAAGTEPVAGAPIREKAS